ncbi:MAG: hypothetical protein ABSG86_16185 [Thermoguttaceae bacterium]
MSELAKLVIKTFPEHAGMQLVRLRMPAEFHCSRCDAAKKAALLAVVSGDWQRLLCKACYIELLSEQPE